MSSLNEAFEFLFEFKAGNVEIGMPVASKHAENIKLLAMDLLVKEVDVSGLSASELNGLLGEMASLDSRWNHSLQQCLDRAYRLAGQGSLDDATTLLDSFVKDCPSRFYTEIAADVKEEILGGELK